MAKAKDETQLTAEELAQREAEEKAKAEAEEKAKQEAEEKAKAAKKPKLVKMIRDKEAWPAPHEAMVHPDEVNNYRPGGWEEV